MIILLFFSILSLTAISQNAEKKITIQNKNISLKEAFEQIELQTDGRSPREAGNKEKPDDQSYGYHRRPYDQHGRSRQICQRLR